MWGQVKQLRNMYVCVEKRAINRINGPNGNFSEQHANSLTELFGEYMNVALTGSVKGKKKSSIRAIRKWYY